MRGLRRKYTMLSSENASAGTCFSFVSFDEPMAMSKEFGQDELIN